MITAEQIEARIREGLREAEVTTNEFSGGSDHWEVKVITPEFAGKPPLKRHRMVYALFEEELKGPIHALTLTTLTPEEAQDRT